jgi:hypothetical protein
MRTSRSRVTAPAAYDPPSPSLDDSMQAEFEERDAPGACGHQQPATAWGRHERQLSRDADAPPPGQLEEWEEEALVLLSPESQKRERRRIANRDCARRIRQRKTVRAGSVKAAAVCRTLRPAC